MDRFADLGWNTPHLTKFMQSIEDIKMTLSNHEVAYLDLAVLGGEGQMDINKEEFENAISDLLDETIEIVQNCLENSQISYQTVKTGILLVGGSSHIPLVKSKLENAFPGVIFCKSVDVHQVVSQGACLYACKKQAMEMGRYFSPLPMYAHTYTPYQVNYSFGGKLTKLVEKGWPHNTIQKETIEIPPQKDDMVTMHLWQIVEEDKPVWFGNVNVSKYAGKKITMQVKFDSCGELLLSVEECVLSIEYGCMIRNREKNRFRSLTRVLEKASEGLRKIREMKAMNYDEEFEEIGEMDANQIDQDNKYFEEILKEATDNLFPVISSNSDKPRKWSKKDDEKFNDYVNEMEQRIQRYEEC